MENQTSATAEKELTTISAYFSEAFKVSNLISQTYLMKEGLIYVVVSKCIQAFDFV